ncbi:unnamed protein product [Periconia digitata]|uniref:Uncharacterized protein n=1 Tax=Periconia digitata TaxID=1303443 RepID=A0A9W4XPV2_9PLEO|nr:unnamed protein product [Periconia digitata]
MIGLLQQSTLFVDLGLGVLDMNRKRGILFYKSSVLCYQAGVILCELVHLFGRSGFYGNVFVPSEFLDFLVARCKLRLIMLHQSFFVHYEFVMFCGKPFFFSHYFNVVSQAGLLGFHLPLPSEMLKFFVARSELILQALDRGLSQIVFSSVRMKQVVQLVLEHRRVVDSISLVKVLWFFNTVKIV